MSNYPEIAKTSRKVVLNMIYKAGTSHIGSNFGAADLFAVLFEKLNLDRDKFVLSCGWKAALLYFHLWKKGRITEDDLNSYCQEGSKWIGLAEPVHKDVPFAGGSMGMGFPASVGYALSKKLKGGEGTIYCFMSDGEQQIGTTWEAAMLASQHKLSNLVVIVDYNALQAMGSVKDILNLEPLADKWRAFGWCVTEIDGHDYDAIEEALAFPTDNTQPQVIIANTVKGKGVSWMEGQNLWHYAQVKEEDYNKAMLELV